VGFNHSSIATPRIDFNLKRMRGNTNIKGVSGLSGRNRVRGRTEVKRTFSACLIPERFRLINFGAIA